MDVHRVPLSSFYRRPNQKFLRTIFSVVPGHHKLNHGLISYSRLGKYPCFSSFTRESIRNVAIIAHVDHGKTSLVDQIMRQTFDKPFHGSMDKNVLEQERGITILSKCTRIHYAGKILNIVDTPGHADFGGEVERILSMVDGVVLVVDLLEGPKTQTKFVLKKALAQKNLMPLVVVNKIDRESNRTQDEIDTEIFDLFCSLNPTPEQLEYPTLYASATKGIVASTLEAAIELCNNNTSISMSGYSKLGLGPLLDEIIKRVGPPQIDERIPTDNFSFLSTIIEDCKAVGYGIAVTGKIYSGSVIKGDKIFAKLHPDTLNSNTCVQVSEDGLLGIGLVSDITVMRGIQREPLNSAIAGDIVALSLKKITPVVGCTICGKKNTSPIVPICIDPPVISAVLSVNTSPLKGQEAKYSTLEQIDARLKRETTVNPGIEYRVSDDKASCILFFRGELQLAVLVETLRREGYEMSLFPPQILYKKCPVTGHSLEPWEHVQVICPSSSSTQLNVSTLVTERMNSTGGHIMDIETKKDGTVVMECHISSRNFMGFRSWAVGATRGSASIQSSFLDYRKKEKKDMNVRNGTLICTDDGLTTKKDILKFWEKGTVFVGEREKVYQGQIIGESNSNIDFDMNATKGSDMRPSSKTVSGLSIITVPPPQRVTIEWALTWMAEDELLEITPLRLATRKRILDQKERRKNERMVRKI